MPNSPCLDAISIRVDGFIQRLPFLAIAHLQEILCVLVRSHMLQGIVIAAVIFMCGKARDWNSLCIFVLASLLRDQMYARIQSRCVCSKHNKYPPKCPKTAMSGFY